MPVILWINSKNGHTAEECARLYNVPPLLSMWYQGLASAVLLVRTHAFLGQQLPVLVGLCTTLGVVLCYQIYVGVAQMARESLSLEPLSLCLICMSTPNTALPFLAAPYTRGPCLPTTRYQGSPHITLWFIFPLVFDIIVLAMTITHGIRIRRRAGGNGGEIKLCRLFVREGELPREFNYALMLTGYQAYSTFT